MTKSWAAFASTGNPSLPEEGLVWQQVETAPGGRGQTFLNISGPTPSMASSKAIADRMHIWQSVIG